ncbi:ATP-grasp domain-containing protein [Salinibacter ruber]|uniref:ATP-grasp domain-containing protein n=1 Tax=Salinibacter ruber TaxID=146919 RepID=UPI00311A9769
MNILFTNAGRRSYLIEDALRLKRNYDNLGDIYVSDTSVMTASMWVSEDIKKIITPRVIDNPDKYLEILLNKSLKHNIDVIFPLMDFELPVLSENKGKFQKNGIKVIISDSKVIKSSLNKKRCYNVCNNNNIKTPKTWYEGEALDKSMMPFVMKKKRGSGSAGMRIINESDKIPNVVPDQYIVQKFIEGQEYGMDVLNTTNGEFLHCCVRRKALMRAGETDKAEVIYNDNFFEAGKKIGRAFGHKGNMDIDFIVDKDGNMKFIDFNPRFGGGYPFTKAAGFDYLRAMIENIQGNDVSFDRVGKKVAGAKGLKVFTYEK